MNQKQICYRDDLTKYVVAVFFRHRAFVILPDGETRKLGITTRLDFEDRHSK